MNILDFYSHDRKTDNAATKTCAGKTLSFIKVHQICNVALGHEHKLLRPSGVNAPKLLTNWFWWVGSVVCRFYFLGTSSKGSSLLRFPTLYKKRSTMYCY